MTVIYSVMTGDPEGTTLEVNFKRLDIINSKDFVFRKIVGSKKRAIQSKNI